jgi:phospholipase C
VGPGLGRERIEHVIVLMLENRSFDHLLGYLDHPDPRYPNLARLDPPASCPADPANPRGRTVRTSPDAHTILGADPDHSPEAVRLQLFGRPDPAPGAAPSLAGFVRSYGRKIEGDSPAPAGPLAKLWGSILSGLKDAWRRLLGRPARVPRAADIMRCFDERHAPTLSALARHYAVLTHWHASVPGETWPNRNFAHAATSDGTDHIELRFYPNRTIFDQLGDAGVDWRVYHDGIAQVWAFPSLWRKNRDHFRPAAELFADLAAGNLPPYTFVEPNHGYGLGEGNSQHPANNTDTGDSFTGGEELMARIYHALAGNPAVFAKTLLLITYDEHGGFFDHEPPVPVVPPDGLRAADGFDFALSGVRVPAVAVSPLIPKGCLDETGYEHSSIPRTVRAQFAPQAPPLTARDAAAPDLLATLPLLSEPRTDLAPVPVPGARPAGVPAPGPLTGFEASLLSLAGAVHAELAAPAGFTPALAPAGVLPFRPEPELAEAARLGRLVPGSAAAAQVDTVVRVFAAPAVTPADA